MPLSALLAIVGVPFAAALLVLLLPERWAARVALLPPVVAVGLGIPLWLRVVAGEVALISVAWFPSLGIQADLRVDRLGAFFVLLIGGVGLAVVQYARHYLRDQASSAFWATLLTFMGAMLGLVLADSLILLFVFWELTTVTSALLIAMDSEREEARRGAVQAFLVTGAGGLALLAGIVLVGELAGTYTFSGLEARAAELTADARHKLPLLLLLVGAFTKSAQFPFHFWLPGAMAAPAPVSAYLHSATMVKAGVFLLGRLFPIFQASPLWLPVLATVGLTTFAVAGWSAVRAYDLKQLLAYSTVAYLGVLTALYGYYARVGTHGELLNILNHALYKSALFLLVGWLEKVSGVRDLSLLEREKWGSREPVGAVLVGIGALAMAGVPFLLGFMSKEVFFAAVTGGKLEGLTLALAVSAVASTLATIYALKLFLGTFGGWEEPRVDRGHPPGTVSRWLLVVPAVLLVPQVIGGVVPGWFLGAVLEPWSEWPGGIAFWRHLDVKLVLSLGILGFGVLGYRHWHRLAAIPVPPGPQRASDGVVGGALKFASWFSRAVQSGGQPRYLAVTLLTASAAVGLPLALSHSGAESWTGPTWGPEAELAWFPVLLVTVAAVMTLVGHSRITKVVMTAIAGFGMAVLYVVFRAPDLALTQLLVETVSLILLVLAFRALPRLRDDRRTPGQRVAHGVVAAAVGVSLAALAWTAGTHAVGDPAGAEQLRLSLPVAKGSNVVNVILVDFRGLDTFGEILVLVIAGLGAAALLGGARPGRSRGRSDSVNPAPTSGGGP